MKKISLIAILVLTTFVCGLAFTQEVEITEVTEVTEVTTVTPAEPAKQRFDIGAGYWYTWSSLDSFVYASPQDSATGILYASGDKISELNNDLDAGLFIVNAEAWIWWRFYVDGFVGWGKFEGEHDDSDWLTLLSSDKWSLSKSDADGDVTTWNLNGYLRIIEEPEDKGYLDIALGYFYYRDDIEHLRNSTLLISNWAVTNSPIVGHDSSDRYTFDGIRLGARGKIRLHDRVAVKASGGICPWLDVKNKGYWNLRGMDIDSSADGTALDLNIGLEFKLTKNLFIEAGYKYISLDSDIGDDTRTLADGTRIKLEDSFEARGDRGGFYAMGRLKI